VIPVDNNDEKHLMVGVDGDADEPRSGDSGCGLGATTKRKWFSQELEQTKKRKPF
jgi:hypothetical protein